MPTEHEFKYLLDRSVKTVRRIQKLALSETYIEQGVLISDKNITVRIRHAKKKDKTTWTMTTKQDTHERVVEIETELGERDAHDLWKCCHSKLRKIRHHILDDKGRMWEVDVFLLKDVEPSHAKCYCVLAEIELPEKAARPVDLPDFIQDHLIFAVPLGDGRFSNKKLWRVDHTNGLYEALGRRDEDRQGKEAG